MPDFDEVNYARGVGRSSHTPENMQHILSENSRAVEALLRKMGLKVDQSVAATCLCIEEKGAELIALINGLKSEDIPSCARPQDHIRIAHATDRDLNIAVERVEEAVMWAVKHITT